MKPFLKLRSACFYLSLQETFEFDSALKKKLKLRVATKKHSKKSKSRKRGTHHRAKNEGREGFERED